MFYDTTLPALLGIDPQDVAALHAHTVPLCALSFVSFLVLATLSAVLSPLVFGDTFHKLTGTEKLDWHGRAVGAAFAVAVLTVALPEYLSPGAALVADPLFGSTPRSHLAVTTAVGYFAWDVMFCLAQHATIQGPVLVHGLAVFSLYASILQPPFIQGTACFFLCWEASTPLLNLRAQLIACGRAHGPLYAAVSVAFAAAFLGVRLGLGLPRSVRWWGDMLGLLAAGDERASPALIYYALACNVVLNSLNLFWGYKIASGIVRLAGGGGAGGGKKKKEV